MPTEAEIAAAAQQQQTQDPVATPQVTPQREPKVTAEQLQATPPPGTQPEPKTPAPAPKEVTLEDDADIPEEADLLKLSRKGLVSRLERHTKAQLKERFGTDNVEQIKADLAELKEFREKKEADRQAQLTREEKLKEDRRKYRTEAREYRRKAQIEANERAMDSVQYRVERVTEKLIDPEAVQLAHRNFADYIGSSQVTDAQRRAMFDDKTGDLMAEWFKGWVEKNPKFGKNPPPPQVITEPLNHGANSSNAPGQKPPGGAPPKNFAPGAENAMSPAEALAEARKAGYDYR